MRKKLFVPVKTGQIAVAYCNADIAPDLVYHTNVDLFVKTIGLLFSGLSVIKSL